MLVFLTLPVLFWNVIPYVSVRVFTSSVCLVFPPLWLFALPWCVSPVSNHPSLPCVFKSFPQALSVYQFSSLMLHRFYCYSCILIFGFCLGSYSQTLWWCLFMCLDPMCAALLPHHLHWIHLCCCFHHLTVRHLLHWFSPGIWWIPVKTLVHW